MSKKAQKPTQLRKLEGGRSNSLKKPEDALKTEPKPNPKAPGIPPDIDNEAKEVWKKLAPKLERLGLLCETDGDAFAILCQIRSRLKAIHEFIKDKNASLVQQIERPSPDGGVKYEIKPSPYVVMEKQYYQLFRIYAKEFAGGQVDPATGDFVFGISEGYLLENGKVGAPIKNATLIGNGPEILKRIEAVADDLDFAPGFCGKQGQSMANEVGQPTIKVSAITVGGTG